MSSFLKRMLKEKGGGILFRFLHQGKCFVFFLFFVFFFPMTSFIDFSYFWLWWIFHTVWAPWLRCVSLLLWWLLLLQSVGSRHRASVAVARGLSSVGPGLQSTDLVTPSHVRSSQIRDQSPISYIGRWILYH